MAEEEPAASKTESTEPDLAWIGVQAAQARLNTPKPQNPMSRKCGYILNCLILMFEYELYGVGKVISEWSEADHNLFGDYEFDRSILVWPTLKNKFLYFLLFGFTNFFFLSYCGYSLGFCFP